jgi:Rrf2 family protein
MKSLLKVTSRARLGLILVSELALRKEGERLPLEEVARKAGASRKFLEQIACELRRAGLVEGRRGAAGGYRLIRDPKTLTIAEVLNAVEGPMPLDDCTAHQVKGQKSKVKGILQRIQGQVMATLMNTTIADVARRYAR